MGLRVSGAPFTVPTYSVSRDPEGVWPATTDIRFRAEEKWKRWKIFSPCVFFFIGTTVSPEIISNELYKESDWIIDF